MWLHKCTCIGISRLPAVIPRFVAFANKDKELVTAQNRTVKSINLNPRINSWPDLTVDD